ncbi:MAG TPA: chemotaxis protein CheW [Myxococcales bacterium]|nr:chemotaxis protein CheW [Myxococcales bacterium]
MNPRPLSHLHQPGADQRELLDRRAARLRERIEVVEEEHTVGVAELPAGDHTYVIEMRYLHAVMPLRQVSPVPLAPAHVVGVVRFQGEVLPVLSFASVVDVGGWRRDPEVLLVVEAAGQRVGLDSEQVPRATFLPARLVEESRARDRSPVMELVVGGRRVRMLDLPVLLEGLRERHGA